MLWLCSEKPNVYKKRPTLTIYKKFQTIAVLVYKSLAMVTNYRFIYRLSFYCYNSTINNIQKTYFTICYFYSNINNKEVGNFIFLNIGYFSKLQPKILKKLKKILKHILTQHSTFTCYDNYYSFSCWKCQEFSLIWLW